VITNRQDDVLRVKNGPVFRGGKRQAIFVVNGGEAIRREVNVGQRNGDYVEIVSGLKAGDKIIISDTKEYDQLSTLQLNQ
jgi:HlyD family secretion protein